MSFYTKNRRSGSSDGDVSRMLLAEMYYLIPVSHEMLTDV